MANPCRWRERRTVAGSGPSAYGNFRPIAAISAALHVGLTSSLPRCLISVNFPAARVL